MTCIIIAYIEIYYILISGNISLAYIRICDIPEVFTESKPGTRVMTKLKHNTHLNTLCSTRYLLNRSAWALKSYAKLAANFEIRH